MISAKHTEALIAIEAVVPIRKAPSESAEMISQLLFGDCGFLLGEKTSWSHIRTVLDEYEGWVDTKMLNSISLDQLGEIEDYQFVLEGSLIGIDNYPLSLARGTGIPQFSPEKTKTISLGPYTWKCDDKMKMSPVMDRSHLIEVAYGFLNTPYLWGGCSGYGIDCSGLTQRVFRMCGIQIPRDSSQQAKIGQKISFQDRQKGDLAFFAKPQQERITHVGLIIDQDSILHASGRVRIDRLTDEGIWNETLQSFTHQLITIQRC